jgi:hypothetical protein
MRRKRFYQYVETYFDDLFGYDNLKKEPIDIVSVRPDITEYIKAENLLLKHFDFLWHKAYPSRGIDSYKEHRLTVEDGSWTNLGSLLEHAIHIVGGIKKINGVGKDFDDISDAKLISVRTSSKGLAYTAPVTNIHRKRGFLRVVCYERKQDKHYFFLIPFSAYEHIPKTSNIEIPFELNGNPRKINKCNVNWWDFEKLSFQEICVSAVAKPTTPNIVSPIVDLISETKTDPNLQMSIPCSLENDQPEI